VAVAVLVVCLRDMQVLHLVLLIPLPLVLAAHLLPLKQEMLVQILFLEI
jgi:hypothetical protein